LARLQAKELGCMMQTNSAHSNNNNNVVNHNSREISLEGYLMKKEQGMQSWKKMYFKINKNNLESYVTKKDPDVSEVISLRGCTVKLEKVDGYMTVLHIWDSQGREHLMYASPLPETFLWKDALSLAIAHSQSTQETHTVQSTSSTSTYTDYINHVQNVNTTTTCKTNPTPVPENKDGGYLVQLFYYLVKQGESINDIASIFNVSVPWIQGCNSVRLDVLTPGNYVIVPFSGELPCEVASNPVLMQAHSSVMTQGMVAGASQLEGDDTLCKICFEKPINTVLLECGHSALCGGCAQAITGHPCPFCRRPVSRVVATYRS